MLQSCSVRGQGQKEICFADPTVYVENGKYYLTGTRTGEPSGFTVLESEDLLHWNYPDRDTMILHKGDSTFGNKGFWAPQLLRDGDMYRLTYTADEQTVLSSSDNISDLTGRRI